MYLHVGTYQVPYYYNDDDNNDDNDNQQETGIHGLTYIPRRLVLNSCAHYKLHVHILETPT